MQILIMNQFFWPDTAATGQLLADLTRGLDPNLHVVTVLCGKSPYGVADTTPPPPVKIVRLGSVPFSRNKVGRVVSYMSFFAAATMHGLRGPKPTIVLTMTTPPLLSLLGSLIKRLRGSRHFIWEMDLYPDIAIDLNVLKPRSWITRLIWTVADFSRRRADGIIVLGEDMKTRLVARAIPENKIIVAENWADGCEILPAPFREGPFVVHYSGTFGLAHDEQTILGAIRQMRNDYNFRFVFAGGGARRQRVEEFCRAERNSTVEFRPYAKRSDLSRGLAEGHVGLVTQIPETSGSIVPSKVYGIMAAGRPILYIGPRGTTPANIIERYGCGWRIEPGDVQGLVGLLRQLDQDRGLLNDAGVRARGAFEEHYDKPIGVARVLSILGISPVRTPTIAVAAASGQSGLPQVRLPTLC